MNPIISEKRFSKVPTLLKKHMQNWLEAGLLTQDQAALLLENSAQKLSSSSRNLMGVILSAIAGIFVLVGLILIIAEHWNGIDHRLKLAAGLALLGSLQWFGWKWMNHSDSAKAWMGQGFLLAGGGMILGMIALVSQIYNLNSRPANGVLLWLILLIPLVQLTRSTPLWLMGIGVLTTWLGMEMNLRDSWFYLNYGNIGVWQWSMIGFLIWALAEFQKKYFHSTGIVFVRFSGISIFLGTMIVLGFQRDHYYGRDEYSFPWSALVWIGCTLSIWIYSRLRDEDGLKKILLLDLLITGLVVIGLWSCYEKVIWFEPVLWATHFALCILMVREGAEHGSSLFVNMGVIFILISVISRYFDFFDNYLTGGIFFIVTGLFIFGLVWFMEKQRRKWIAKARQHSSTI